MRYKAVRAVLLLPWLAIAAVRVSIGYRGRRLDDLALWLGHAPKLPVALRDPRLIAAMVSHAVPLLPPRTMGRCLKRSLILLDLWSRCGLTPALHIGIGGTGDARICHAWVTALDHSSPPPEAGCFTEIFTLPARSFG